MGIDLVFLQSGNEYILICFKREIFYRFYSLFLFYYYYFQTRFCWSQSPVHDGPFTFLPLQIISIYDCHMPTKQTEIPKLTLKFLFMCLPAFRCSYLPEKVD